MGFTKTDVDGKIMWENNSGERRFNPEDKNKDKYGWHKIDVNGVIMWESPDGERSR